MQRHHCLYLSATPRLQHGHPHRLFQRHRLLHRHVQSLQCTPPDHQLAQDPGVHPTIAPCASSVVSLVTWHGSVAVAYGFKVMTNLSPPTLRQLRPSHRHVIRTCRPRATSFLLPVIVAHHPLVAAHFPPCGDVRPHRSRKTSYHSSRGENCVPVEPHKASLSSDERNRSIC